MNNELHPLRVSAALVRMAKLISKQPMRVAILMRTTKRTWAGGHIWSPSPR